MINKNMFSMIIISFFLLSACQSNSKDQVMNPVVDPTTDKFSGYMQCKDPRPEICTQEYAPVCATKDTGIRCVTTPCPSTEQVTKSNACAACGDENVNGYILGECE